MKGLKGKSICVYSPKGGTGKTIIAASLAAIAAKEDKKVLLVDFDLYNGALAMFINKEITKNIYNIGEDLNNNRYTSFEDYVYQYNKNIDILCAPKDPRQGHKIECKYLEIIIEKACNIYDVVIIDTYSNLDETTITVLDNSDDILFIITNDMFTIKNTKNLITIFNDNGIDNYKILINNSNDPKLPFFSNAEIKRIIDANIDYSISKNFFIKELSSYISSSVIPLTKSNDLDRFSQDVKVYEKILKDILGDAANEKE